MRCHDYTKVLPLIAQSNLQPARPKPSTQREVNSLETSKYTMESEPDAAKTSQQYPKPIIVEPLQTHRQSFIILHGRGANALNFAQPLLHTTLSDGQTFQQSFPNAKFIFPTASFREVAAFKQTPVTQWFDIWSLSDTTEKSELQIEGLRETTAFLHSLMQKEIELVGARNVVLGGLSQESAAMLISILLWPGEQIPKAFGMSGWLPMHNLLEEASKEPAEEAIDDIFDRTERINHPAPEEDAGKFQKAMHRLRKGLDIPLASVPKRLQTEIFLGHGGQDWKVVPQHGQKAMRVLNDLGCKVQLQLYPNLGHWYHPDELQDVKDFLNKSSDD